MLDDPLNKRTFTLEGLRSLPGGVLETLVTTFSILIANRVFQASDMAKASLVALPSVGLLLSLFIVQAVRRSQLSVNAMSAIIFSISGTGFGLSSFAGDRFDLYLAGMVIALTTISLNVPLISQIHQRHYPKTRRGGLFSITAFSRKTFAILAAIIFGILLERSLSNYAFILRCYAGASLLSALCVLMIDKVTLSRSIKVRLFEAFRHTREDCRFGKLLVSWMILGLGNLISFALFVEYISNPKYGFDFDEKTVSFITTVTPEACFLVFVLLWGRLFDKIDFYVLRALVNLCFAVGIIFYFMGNGTWALYVGIGFHGIAKAGGNIVWSLWVTKFATPDNTAEYMSVHTFLTGCRGVIAPFLAFQIASTLGPQVAAGIGAGMIVIATLMIVPDIKNRHQSLPQSET